MDGTDDEDAELYRRMEKMEEKIRMELKGDFGQFADDLKVRHDEEMEMLKGQLNAVTEQCTELQGALSATRARAGIAEQEVDHLRGVVKKAIRQRDMWAEKFVQVTSSKREDNGKLAALLAAIDTACRPFRTGEGSVTPASVISPVSVIGSPVSSSMGPRTGLRQGQWQGTPICATGGDQPVNPMALRDLRVVLKDMRAVNPKEDTEPVAQSNLLDVPSLPEKRQSEDGGGGSVPKRRRGGHSSGNVMPLNSYAKIFERSISSLKGMVRAETLPPKSNKRLCELVCKTVKDFENNRQRHKGIPIAIPLINFKGDFWRAQFLSDCLLLAPVELASALVERLDYVKEQLRKVYPAGVPETVANSTVQGRLFKVELEQGIYDAIIKMDERRVRKEKEKRKGDDLSQNEE